MKGLEGFFSPIQPLHTKRKPTPPWEVEEKNNSRMEYTGNPNPSATYYSAAPRPALHPPQHPELAPTSGSSGNSSPSPNKSDPENNVELRRRLTAVTAGQPPVPRRVPQQKCHPSCGQRNPPRRRWPARACLCRICSCLAILALLGVIIVLQLVMSFKREKHTLPVVLKPVDHTGVHFASPESVQEGKATATLPSVEGKFQPNAEGKSGHSVSIDGMPASPVKTPVISKTSTSSQAKMESADPADDKKESQDEQCWIFMHMERSGGAAARQIATEHWRKDELVYDSVQWRRGDSHAEDVMLSRWKLLHGGCVEAVRNDEALTCKWLTVFRHPVARLLSAYDHCREAPRDPICPPTKSADLTTFAERWGNFAVRQFALATVSPSTVNAWVERDRELPQGTSVWYLIKEYFTRGGVALDDVVLGEDVLDSIKETLSTYAAVGIATELDATMRLLDKALPIEGLGWSSSFRKLRKQGDEEQQYDDSASARFQEALANPRISSALRLDTMLFDHAVHVFQGQVAQFRV